LYLFSSRSSIAKDAGKENFNLTECETIVASGLSDSATLDDVRSAVVSCEKILKYYRSSSINDSKDSIKNVELKKVELHQKNIHIRTQNQPSDEDKLLARELVRKPLSKLKSDKRELMEDVREFNVSLVNSVSAIKKSINAIDMSTREKTALRKLHAELVAIVHQATKAEIGTATESLFHVADLMKQLYHRSDLIEECISLMSMEKYSHIPALAVLQKKFELLEEGLSSMKTDSPMDQSIFLKRWDTLEDEEAGIISSATCEEVLYVDENGNIVPPGTKDAIELVPPGGKFALNKMTGVRRGLLTMLIKHWHPNLPDGWLETLLEMLENGVPPNLESDLKNGCITAWTNLITSILHSEAGGQVTTELIEAVKESISFNDNFDLFAHTKKFPLVQFAKAAEMLSIKMLQLVLRSKSRELAQVVTNKLEGSTSNVGIASKEVFVDHYTLVGAGITADGDTVSGSFQHGEALCNPDVFMTVKTITPKALDAQSLGTGILFSNVNDMHVSSFSDSMGIASGRSGESISDDALEEINRAMFYQRSKNAVQAFQTSKKNGVGIPKMFLDKCQAEGIVATIENAQSLFNTYLMSRRLHPFQLANLEQCQERGVVGANASNSTSLLQIDKMNAGDHNFQDHYLKMCQEKGITHDKNGKPVTAKNAQSAWNSTNNTMKNPAVVEAANDTKFKKAINKTIKGCTSKEEKINEITEHFAVFECAKCEGKEQIGKIKSEKRCETKGCENCHGRNNKTGKLHGSGVNLPQEPGLSVGPVGRELTTTGESYNGKDGTKNPRRKCWVFKRYLKPEEVATLLSKVEEK